MYCKGQSKGTVNFSLRPAKQAGRVAVAGDFNGWKPTVMRKQKDGAFVASVAVRPGRFEYKYLVDGEWVHDPDVPAMALNCYGTVNSVLVVD